jgi:hypothetical protein
MKHFQLSNTLKTNRILSKKYLAPFLMILLIAILFLVENANAQAPEKMSYQAVIRDAGENLLVNKAIKVRISVLSGSATGSIVYSETHSVSTNENGLVTLSIGSGTVISGTFSSINWASGIYFIKTETDPTGGTNYSISGTSQLLSVPFAFYAKNSGGDGFWKTGANGIYHNTGNVGIGTNNPSSALHVSGEELIDNNGKIFLGNNRIFFEDEGSISSFDDYHKILFRRSENILELNEFGKIVFSPGTMTDTLKNKMVLMPDGKIGIGTATPTALLHVNGNGTGEGNVLFTGFKKGVDPGDPPASGSGTRMMWYPDKAAFRAGIVYNTNWDKDSIGYYSVGMGWGTLAKGDYSTALGLATKATGVASFTNGNSTAASGGSSTAMGQNSKASGYISMAAGMYTVASGSISTALGSYSNASGDYSFAINLNDQPGPLVAANTFRISGATTIGGNVAWNNYSDIRLKKDIQKLSTENNLEKIILLNGVRFRWKDNDSLLNLGFIAQEVLNIIPESVRYDKLNDIYSMEYTAIIPVLVEGMKEQQQQIEQLKNENLQLQNSLNELKQLKADIELLKSKLP